MPEKYIVNVNGTDYTVTVSPADEPNVSPEPSENSVTILAPIEGIVLRYNAYEGDEVTPDDIILIMESMEMELPIKATAQGKLHFLVAEGAQVASQQAIARIG